MKTFKISAVFSLLALFSLMFTSCSKEEFGPTNKMANRTLDVRAQDCNEFNHVGAYHNEGLAFLLSNEEFLANPSVGADEKAAYLKSQLEVFLGSIEVNGEGYSDGSIDWDPAFEADYADYDAVLDQNRSLSSEEKHVLSSFYGSILASDLSNGRGLDRFVSSTQDLECSIAGNRFENQEAVFSSIAIGKFSADYWVNGSYGGNGTESVNWRDVALADALGALHGMAAGPWGSLGFAILGSALSYAHQEGYI
ncbi:MAG: hypothetical protein F6K19_42650 [Cyanothece sp. SIO1E1]|nr:hypothetical protein [Cyanothece sp. SIO1E1]